MRWLLVLLLFAVGCGGALRVQTHVASAIGHSANAGLPVLVQRYRGEGTVAIRTAKTREDAKAAIAAIKAKWKPVWRAWETVHVAQNAWADALESGGDTAAALSALKKAYCGLMKVWPKDIPAVPLGPLKCAAEMAELGAPKPAKALAP